MEEVAAKVVDVPEGMELDLEGVDGINKNTLAGKDPDASFTKRVYKRVNESLQNILLLIAGHG
jgi:hypothetical protein